jgi:hypothetical protein
MKQMKSSRIKLLQSHSLHDFILQFLVVSTKPWIGHGIDIYCQYTLFLSALLQLCLRLLAFSLCALFSLCPSVGPSQLNLLPLQE